jgi:hypothetical protein
MEVYNGQIAAAHGVYCTSTKPVLVFELPYLWAFREDPTTQSSGRLRRCKHVAAILWALNCLQLQESGNQLPDWLTRLDKKNAKYTDDQKKRFAKISVNDVMQFMSTPPQPGEPGIFKVEITYLDRSVSVQSKPTVNLQRRPMNRKRKRQESYCYETCSFSGAETGRMIQCFVCENWFHFECVDLDQEPAHTEEWVCPEHIPVYRTS